MTTTENIRLHAIVEGRVQGVGFRYFVLENALSLGITGWVRNRWDGTVEITAEGDKITLELFLSKVNRGSPSSYVTKVSQSWHPYQGEFKRFRIRQTV